MCSKARVQMPVRLCLYRVDSPHPVRDHIRAGDVLPADRGTGARVLIAFDPERSRAAVRDRKLYAAIREHGYYAAEGRPPGRGGPASRRRCFMQMGASPQR
jgi:DNA-binding IclR family transcriptional regulator